MTEPERTPEEEAATRAGSMTVEVEEKLLAVRLLERRR